MDKTNLIDLTGKIIEFENGELDADGVVDLFATLIQNGYAWQLQGSYGCAAKTLIENGIITSEGEITPEGYERLATATI